MNRIDRQLASWLTPQRCRVYARTLAAIMMGGYLVSQYLGPGRSDAAGTLVGADFSAFWIGGRMLLDGQADHLYDFAAQKTYYDSLIAPVVTPTVHPYVNPPFFAVAMTPLAALPYDLALGLWWAGQVLILAGLAHWFRQEFASLQARPLARTIALAFLFFPTLAWFCYGQNTGGTLALLSTWFISLRQGRDWRAGLALGLLFFKPQLGLGPFLVLVFRRRYRALAGAALGAALWIAIGMLVVPELMLRYVEIAPRLFEFLRRSDYNAWGLLSGFGFGILLLDDVSKTLGSLLGHGATFVGILTISFISWRMRWSPGARRWDLTMAGLIALGIVTSPHLFLYDAMLLLLPMAILLAHEPGAPERVLDGGPLLARSGWLYILLFAGPYLTFIAQRGLSWFGAPKVVPQLATLAIVLFALELIRVGARSHEEIDEQT